MQIERVLKAIPQYVGATGTTLTLTICSIVLGVILGLLLALGRISKNKVLNGLSWLYIWVFRGTPMLMQIYFMFYVLPLISPKLMMPEFPTAVLALSLNSGAYLAEIIRAAIQSIDRGQMEAAKALGMSYGLTMRRVIIPQSIRRMLPPFGNEFIMLLKDTSLVAAIGMVELLKVARSMTSSYADAFYFLPVAIIYLLLTTIFTWVFEQLEKKYSIYE